MPLFIFQRSSNWKSSVSWHQPEAFNRSQGRRNNFITSKHKVFHLIKAQRKIFPPPLMEALGRPCSTLLCEQAAGEAEAEKFPFVSSNNNKGRNFAPRSSSAALHKFHRIDLRENFLKSASHHLLYLAHKTSFFSCSISNLVWHWFPFDQKLFFSWKVLYEGESASFNRLA